MFRNIVAIVAAPMVWGLVGVPANQLIVSFFANDNSGGFSTTVLVVSLVASFVYSIICGAAAALIARTDFTRIGLCAGLAVLLVGLAVQIGSWSMFPVWYHVAFLAALVPFCMLGAAPVQNRRS